MWWPSTAYNTISAVPGFSRMWNGCNCDMFRFKSQLAAKKMYNSRQIIWPFPVILLFPWARSWYLFNKSIKKSLWWKHFDILARLISETWQVYSTDSLKKSSSKAIPRSQTKVTFWPNPIGFPFLTKKVFICERQGLFAHSVCANLCLNVHSLCANFDLNAHSMCKFWLKCTEYV